MMNRVCSLAVLLAVCLAPFAARAAGDEVVVIYNSRVPESKSVAEHYARLRQVPERQLYGLNLSTNEEISRAEFRDSLQLPLAKKLESDGLWRFGEVAVAATNGQPARKITQVLRSKIRYAVLCYGVPLKIRDDPELREAIAETLPPLVRRNEAAVDSELTWLPLSRTTFPLTGPFPNWLYAATNTGAFTPTNGFLIVSRLDGPSAEVARGLVDKAMAAERDGLWGRAYFDARGVPRSDTNYFLGDQWILTAARVARQLGFETTLDDLPGTFPASFPMSHIAIYCGWYDVNACGPFSLPRVEFMDGAIAYHIHSFSAATLRSATNCWCGPFLAKGATCTMGCVYEPYLGYTPNIGLFLEALARGYTFGEAAWASQAVLSWQTAVIGDPLYRPFGRTLPQLHAELTRTRNPLDEWYYSRLSNLALLRGARVAEVAGLLENLDATTNSAVLTEKLADLYEAQGKPASSLLMCRNALGLNPSPEQRIRLRLALGEKLMAQGREAEAVADYQELLAESPDYPGRESITNKLSQLQQKSAGTQAAAHP